MDKTIKTRDVVKDIKTLDKKAAGLAAVRDIHTKVKEVAERAEAPSQQQRHGADYAQSKVEQGARSTTRGARRSGMDGTKKAADAARNAHRAVKDAIQVAANTTKRTIKQGTRGGVKTTAKSIKTAGSTAGKAIKTSKQTAQAGKAAAKAVRHLLKGAASVCALCVRYVVKRPAFGLRTPYGLLKRSSGRNTASVLSCMLFCVYLTKRYCPCVNSSFWLPSAA